MLVKAKTTATPTNLLQLPLEFLTKERDFSEYYFESVNHTVGFLEHVGAELSLSSKDVPAKSADCPHEKIHVIGMRPEQAALKEVLPLFDKQCNVVVSTTDHYVFCKSYSLALFFLDRFKYSSRIHGSNEVYKPWERVLAYDIRPDALFTDAVVKGIPPTKPQWLTVQMGKVTRRIHVNQVMKKA